jgi:hypothetical protein
MSWLVISIPVVLAAVVVLPLLARIILRRWRPQFSLRTLLLVVALVAVLLSVANSRRYLQTATTAWLAPSAPEAERLWAKPAIRETDDGYEVTYRPKRRSVDELNRLASEKRALFPQSSYGSYTHGPLQEIRLQSSDRAALAAWLSAYQEADVLPAGQFVIRGRVEDRQGRPVGGAIVDLRGPNVRINDAQTRSDGTFTLPLKVPPGDEYSLEIRCGDGKVRWTPRFSLAPDEPERVARIRLRW